MVFFFGSIYFYLLYIVLRVDLMQLVEEAVEGCWIGHRARMFTSEIGSVYSPPDRQAMSSPPGENHVETIIDVGPDLQVSLIIVQRC